MLRFAALLLCAVALLAPAQARSAELTRAEEIATRNAIDKALEQVREIILNGDPDSGIPVLDPLVVDEWEFNVDEEPFVSAKGSVSNARVEGLGAFVVEKSMIPIPIIPPRITVNAAIRVPSVSATGDYRLNGDAQLEGQDTHFDAVGNFTVVIKDIKIRVKVVVLLNFKLKSVDVTLGLGDVYINVQGAGDVGDVINNEAAARIEQWFAENRTNLEKELAEIIKSIIENSDLPGKESISHLLLDTQISL